VKDKPSEEAGDAGKEKSLVMRNIKVLLLHTITYNIYDPNK
jgi:hypothetical protein